MKCSSVTFASHSRIFGLLAAAALGVAAQSASAQCPNYSYSAGSGSIVPGATNVGNACDDCATVVALPFNFSFYGTSYSSVAVASNGYLLFNTADPGTIYNENTYCAPSNFFTGAVMFPGWTDGWTAAPAAGIFTSVSGSTPNRIFNIEWRGAYYPGGTGNNNFEVRLYEAPGGQFDFVYGTASNYWNAAVGVQNPGMSQSISIQCNAPLPGAGTKYTFTCPSSGPPTGNLVFTPNSGPEGGTFLATSVVTPGYNPPSTGITVSLDASGINAGTVAMNDNGLNGDAVAGDGTYSANVTVGAGATIGAHTLSATIHDAQNRSSNASATFTVSGANDDCGGAIPAVLGNNPFDNSAATTSSPAAPCGALGADLWYSVSSPTAGSLQVTTCGLTGGDSAIAIYDTDCVTVLACNDDFCGLQSNLCMPIDANHVYKLRIGGFASSIWTGSFNVSVSAAGYTPPPNATPEGEDCNQIFPDNFNGGCNSTPVVYSNAEFCTNYTGTAANSTSFRDTDWWMFNLPTDDDVTVTGQANFAAQCFFVLPTCPGALVPGTPIANPGGCSPDFSITFHLPAGPQVFFMSPLGFDGSAQCGVNGDYWFRISLASNPNCDPYGACCSSTGCTVMTASQCQAAGGTYNGNGSHCSSCPGTGACCTANGCSIITQAACAAAGGSYQGDGASCPVGAPTDYASDPNLAIPDAGPPVTDSVNVGTSYSISHMAVRVTIPDHTYVQDLTVDLTHGSTTVRLWNLQCGSNDGLDVTFDDSGTPVVCAQPTTGTYQPAQPLAAFNGQDASGTWTITVQDHVGADVGTLTHWDMAINGPGVCGPTCDSADFDCDGDVGTDFDIQAFFRCLAGNCPEPPCTNSADFNHDGDTGTDADIEAFFRVLAGNPC